MHPEYLMEVLAVRDNRENNFLRYSLSEEHALSNLVLYLLENLPSNESRSTLLTKRIQQDILARHSWKFAFAYEALITTLWELPRHGLAGLQRFVNEH